MQIGRFHHIFAKCLVWSFGPTKVLCSFYLETEDFYEDWYESIYKYTHKSFLYQLSQHQLVHDSNIGQSFLHIISLQKSSHAYIVLTCSTKVVPFVLSLYCHWLNLENILILLLSNFDCFFFFLGFHFKDQPYWYMFPFINSSILSSLLINIWYKEFTSDWMLFRPWKLFISNKAVHRIPTTYDK